MNKPKTIEDYTYETKGLEYTNHLAQAMGTTREAIIASLLGNVFDSHNKPWESEVDLG
jgi:hypothetical protein